MDTFIEANLEGLKGLLFTGLDFMLKHHPTYLEEYILINRETAAASTIPFEIFDGWVEEWRLSK